VIDTHQHNWRLHQTLAYAWITPGSVLYADFPVELIKPQMDAAGVTACVLVEADNSFTEIAWMLEQARQHAHILGVVGWGDLRDHATLPQLLHFTSNPAFKGVRVYWEEVGELGALDAGLDFLAAHNLSCDLVVKPPVYGQLADVVRRHPGVTFILDHFAGVQHVPGGASMWESAIAPLAALPNTILKLSGYLTAAHPPTVETIQPYFAAALRQFGANRLLYGSDYPVCTTRGQTYADTVAILRALIAPLRTAEQHAITEGTARRVYRI
jgi:L-fuconolactonase